LWGEVNKVGKELFWCKGGAKFPSKAVISGATDKPFFLVSLNQPIPNLHALSLDESTDIKLKEVYCLYHQSIVDLCKNGNRSKQVPFFEKLMSKYNLGMKF
jgi:hypothetical protein